MQMRHAAQKALYVWCSDASVRYAQELARRIGRNDLIIIGPSGLDYRLYGRTFGGLVIDHALVGRLNQHQREMLDTVRAFIRPKEVVNAT